MGFLWAIQSLLCNIDMKNQRACIPFHIAHDKWINFGVLQDNKIKKKLLS